MIPKNHKNIFENRKGNVSIDTLKLKIKQNVYLDLIHLLQDKDNNFYSNHYKINNAIQISLINERYTHITFYGLKTYSEEFDNKNKILLKKVIEYIYSNNLLELTFISQIDIAFDYLNYHPSDLFVYKSYIEGTNKKIKNINLYFKSDYEYKSLYSLDFDYYKARVYFINSYEKNFDEIKRELSNLVAEHFYGLPTFDILKTQNFISYTDFIKEKKLKFTKQGFSRFVLKKLLKRNLEFFKYENGDYYLYIPKKLYESENYKSIKENLKKLELKFKPSTTKSYTVIYDKKNKFNNSNFFSNLLKDEITRVEFVTKFNTYDYNILDIDIINKKIKNNLNKIFICSEYIKYTTFSSFIKKYQDNNLLNNETKQLAIQLVDNLLKN